MKLQQIKDKQFIISLPVAIVRAKGWKKGDTINAVLDSKGDIILRKIP